MEDAACEKGGKALLAEREQLRSRLRSGVACVLVLVLVAGLFGPGDVSRDPEGLAWSRVRQGESASDAELDGSEGALAELAAEVDPLRQGQQQDGEQLLRTVQQQEQQQQQQLQAQADLEQQQPPRHASKSESEEEALSFAADLVLPRAPKYCVTTFFAYQKAELERWGLQPLSPAKWWSVKDVGRDKVRACNVLIQTTQLQDVSVPEGSLMSTLGMGQCVGGGKDTQLKCRRRLALRDGCSFDESGISPLQYDLNDAGECVRLGEQVRRRPDMWWLEKHTTYSGYGKGIFLHRPNETARLVQKWGCDRAQDARPQHLIMVEYVKAPALIRGHKIDVRTYALVARADPFLLFYASGMARISDTPYSLFSHSKNAHITNTHSQARHVFGYKKEIDFATANRELLASGFEPDFFEARFRKRAELISIYVMQAARALPQWGAISRARRYNLYGLDWTIDDRGNAQLLECNMYPGLRNTAVGDQYFADALRLALTAHTAPRKLVNSSWAEFTVRNDYRWKKNWRLIYNELEERSAGRASYNACAAVRDIKATWRHDALTTPAPPQQQQQQRARVRHALRSDDDDDDDDDDDKTDGAADHFQQHQLQQPLPDDAEQELEAGLLPALEEEVPAVV